LIGRIDIDLMREAFKAVKRNRGAAGVDKVSIQMYRANLMDNLHALMRELKSGTFQPLPLRRVFIPKNKEQTEFRPLGIPVVKDRIAQEVLRRLLDPVFRRHFHAASYGFIQGRNCHMAIDHALQLHTQGYNVVLDADIKGFFDNLPHQVIVDAVRERVADGKVLDLLERFLRCGVLEQGRLMATTKGTPQGGVISPLLANIVLNRLDWHLDKLGYRFVRYADDFVVLCQNRSQAEEARTQVEALLAQLGLSLSPQKTVITTYKRGYTLLGFLLSRRSRRIRPKSLEKFKDKVRALTARKHNLDLDLVARLNALIRGVAQYFCAPFATNREQFHKLDSWIRMRMRAMKFKRKSYRDNYKLRVRTFKRIYQLLSLEDFFVAAYASPHRSLTRGSSGRGRPVTETVTPVNMGN
jgi:RNA-directed DNA polymerase